MAKARVKQLPLTEQRRQGPHTEQAGRQPDGPRQERIGPSSASPSRPRPAGSSGKKTQAVMEQIKTQYGDAELQKAIREFKSRSRHSARSQ